jgi:hypothetical protein
VPDVVGVQTTGGTAARNHAHAVAMLQRATKPPADPAGRAAGTNGLAVPGNSASSSNNTSRRSQGLTNTAPADAVEDMTSSSQRSPTSFGPSITDIERE